MSFHPVWEQVALSNMLLVDAAITSGNAAPVPVHWNAPNGTWVQTTASNPVPSGAAVRQLSPGPQASASAGTPVIAT